MRGRQRCASSTGCHDGPLHRGSSPDGARDLGYVVNEVQQPGTSVNAARILTPWRRSKIDPLHVVGLHSSVVAAGTRPRSRSLSR